MPADIQKLKDRVTAKVEALREELIELSLRIHAHPELAFQEEQASAWLADYLESHGFRVVRGICDLPTAFRAERGEGAPRVALLAEYDALAAIGHGCGHNIIATSSVAAGIASSVVVEETGGTIVVIGTPAEEVYGGKVLMARRGAFDELDAAMLCHPGSRNAVYAHTLACAELQVEYFGKEAHASSRPEAGVNALDALIFAFNGIAALRQHIRGSARIHGIITDGGQAPNIVPGHAAGGFLVRAADEEYLEELKVRVIACLEAGALATGARMEYRWGEAQYAAMRTNNPLAEAYRSNLVAVGREVTDDESRRSMGSTDMGNVSALLPAIHPTIAIAPREVSAHSPEFARWAASEDGHRGLLDAAKALAMTAVDVLVVAELRQQMQEAFAGEQRTDA
ncbi:MAG: M20 family metallopeptidase [Chloroflexi bacterium]|nr:M20 family metallopeptidase [Chloroflexota bacterium]